MSTPKRPPHYNPVKIPTNPDVINNIKNLQRIFPESETHLNILRGLGSQFVHAEVKNNDDGRKIGLAYARFSGALEDAFGFTREVMFFYCPYDDLQTRTLEVAKNEIRNSRREITPDIVFFFARDPRSEERLRDWASRSRNLLIIPLNPRVEENPQIFIEKIQESIYTRDLFYETTPVSGGKFFGRATLLDELKDDVMNQRVSGLFGLRKSGKTSILKKLQEVLPNDQFITVFIDLETLPGPNADPTGDFIATIGKSSMKEFKRRREFPNLQKKVKELISQPIPTTLEEVLEEVLEEMSEAGVSLVLLFDEIEFISPAGIDAESKMDLSGMGRSLAILRALAQSNQNFTFLLAGLTNDLIENGNLYGRHNPLFSWAKSKYVSPLTKMEADGLARDLGGRMGIRVESGALEALYDASGGHAFLYRSLASEVVGLLPIDNFQRVMTKSIVLTALNLWRGKIAGNVEEILDHLSKYYPDERILLDILLEDEKDFKLVAPDAPASVEHLRALGLITVNHADYSASEFLEFMR